MKATNDPSPAPEANRNPVQNAGQDAYAGQVVRQDGVSSGSPRDRRDAFRKAKVVLFSLVKGGAVFLAFSLLQCVCYYRHDQFFENGEENTFYAVCVLAELLLSLFLVYSLTRLFTLYDKEKRVAFHRPETPKKTPFQRIRFLLRDPLCLTETAFAAFLFLVTPYGFHFNLVYRASGLFSHSFMRWISGLESAVLFPLLLLFALWGRLTALKYWLRVAGNKKEEAKLNGKLKAFLQFVLTCALYFYMEGYPVWRLLQTIPMLLSFVSGVILYLWSFLVGAAVLFCLLLLLRAMKKRRAFAKRLRSIFAEKGLPAPELHGAYLSLFRMKKGENFSFSADGHSYSVKLLSGSRKWVPMVFTANGEVGYLHSFRIRSTVLFSFTTHFRFGWDAKGSEKKIVILCPVPAKVLLSGNGKVVETDNGDTAGEYTLYTSTAFLNSLERGTLTYVPKEADRFRRNISSENG